MTDATSPIVFTDNPLNPLEVALYEGLADPSKMGLFERLMLETDLYAVPEAGSIGGVNGDDGHKVLREGEQLVLRGVVINDGRDTVTLFTDPRRAVGMFGENTRILAMKGRALLALLQDSVVLLNPDGGKGLLLAPDQLKAVLEHAPIPAPVRPTGAVQLYAVPAGQEPVTLVTRLKEAFAGYPVEAAWLARAAWASDNRVGWYLDVRTDRPSDEVVAILNRAVTGLSFGQEVFDVAVGRTAEDGVGVKVI